MEEIYSRLSTIEGTLNVMQKIMYDVCKTIESAFSEKQELAQEKIKKIERLQKKKNL
ncbi:MAG: hypothetical protein LBF01_00960 [Bacteroidales bacterium]|nr:hypothetical protein [Bacteroidales bacterium]